MESWSPSTVASDSAGVDQTMRWEDYEMDPCEAALFLQNLHKEELISKTVYHCHRCAKRRPSQPSIKGCKPVSSKKEIQCRYELVTYHLKSDPNVFYVFERHERVQIIFIRLCTRMQALAKRDPGSLCRNHVPIRQADSELSRPFFAK